jgi:hypothetical protein
VHHLLGLLDRDRLAAAGGDHDREPETSHCGSFAVDPLARKPHDARVMRLLLDERLRADGVATRAWASVDGDRVRVVDDDGSGGELSVAAVERVMCRYGRELDQTVSVVAEAGTDALELGGGRRLRRLRHHAPVDAIARDYLVWERPDGPPLAVLATHATAALRYLALRLAGEHERDPS